MSAAAVPEPVPSRRRSLHLAFGLALLVRAAALAVGYRQPFLANMLQGEEAMNIAMGRGLVLADIVPPVEYGGQGRPADPEDYKDRPVIHVRPFLLFHMPGTAFVLAFLFKITGSMRLVWWQILWGLLDAAVVYLLYFASRPLFGHRVGLVAAYVFALRWPYAVLATSLLREAPLTFLGVGNAALAWRYRRTENLAWAWALGLALGATVYLRPEFLPLSVAWAAAFVIEAWTRPGLSRARRLAGAVLVLVGCALPLAPWTAYNWRHFHRFVVTQQLKWPSLWSAFGERPNDFGAVNQDNAVTQYAIQHGAPSDAYSWAYDDFFHDRVRWVIRHRFPWLVGLGIERAVRIPLLRNYWGFASAESDAAGYRHSGLSLGQYAAAHPAVFFSKAVGAVENAVWYLLGLIGAILLWRRRPNDRIDLAFWFLPFVYNYAIHVVSAVDSRYLLWSTAFLLPPAVEAVLPWVSSKRMS